MPNLGSWIRHVREDRGLTRQQAAVRTDISQAYIIKIESGYIPAREMIERFITSYGMNPMQARHTRELWEPPTSLPSVEELRERINTPSRIDALAHMDRIGMICVYTDPLWNVLSANESFYRTLPGLACAHNNVAVWLFSARKNCRPATKIALQWEQEARFHTAVLRGAFGLYRTSPRARELFDHLKRDRDFHRVWGSGSGIHVAYARQPNELTHLRDPATGEPYSISIDISDVADTHDIRVCQAFRQPHSGPLEPLRQ
ncbi:helix-turn-helix domain-containing protein [Nocardia sp. SYP-A9097]|uniref:MmyB family transcriptional regulator n=1 Tax=Nocardia sp. SYP-A9097 TaxID=2663237 RepID=UPI001891B7BF|nr:helix-turn-helix domain-containing protein [Nocardia sp. SYP-A9097]